MQEVGDDGHPEFAETLDADLADAVGEAVLIGCNPFGCKLLVIVSL
jgi:hypothetical protein